MAAASRLAGLLADGKGAEALAQMQKLVQAQALMRPETDLPFGVRPGEAGLIGPWRPERTDDGVALRRQENSLDWILWRNVDYIPPGGGARRVVLVGESAARGWLFDPVFNPADALARQLEAAAPGRYQVVDLARTAADLDTLAHVVQALPTIEPDVVVVFAGNNLVFPPLDDSYRDLLAEALRDGGYAAMRRRFVDAVVLPRVAWFLDQLKALHGDHGIAVVVVVPESNLRGWVPAPDIEVPVLANGALPEWYALRRAATASVERAQWENVRRYAVQMSALDGGASPVSWYLQGKAEQELGHGAAARDLLQAARDTVCGLLLDHVNNVITDVRRLIKDFAERNGMRCTDLSTVLASSDLPELPDSRFFLDNCHLTDEAIERVMCLVADAVLGQPAGTARPGEGAPPSARAVAHALAAAYCAYRGQPAGVVCAQLNAALDADPEAARGFLDEFLDVLESHGPKWIDPSLPSLLMSTPQAFMLCLQLAQTRHHSLGFWTLRDTAHTLLGRRRAEHHRPWARTDLLALPDGRGFRTPSFAPGKAYYEETSERTRLAFALGEAAAGVLRLTYRMPATANQAAIVKVNDVEIGCLSSVPDWSCVALDVPTEACRDGVNWVMIEWPTPVANPQNQLAADAAALARRMFPRVLPVFGALFSAFFCRDGQSVGPHGKRPIASRTDYSTGWGLADAPTGADDERLALR